MFVEDIVSCVAVSVVVFVVAVVIVVIVIAVTFFLKPLLYISSSICLSIHLSISPSLVHDLSLLSRSTPLHPISLLYSLILWFYSTQKTIGSIAIRKPSNVIGDVRL